MLYLILPILILALYPANELILQKMTVALIEVGLAGLTCKSERTQAHRDPNEANLLVQKSHQRHTTKGMNHPKR